MTQDEFEKTMKHLDALGPVDGLETAFREIMRERKAHAAKLAEELLSKDPSWQERTFFEICLEFGPDIDFITLSELHDALGGYKNQDRDEALCGKMTEQIQRRGLGHLLTTSRDLLGPAALPINPN